MASEPAAGCNCRHAEPAYSIDLAAQIKSVSPDTIRRAIHSTAPSVLPAKKVGNRYRILASDLDHWFESLPDA